MGRWGIAAIALALVVGTGAGTGTGSGTGAGTAAAQETYPARFTLQGDAEGGIWVLDGLTGDVARCRAGGEPSPRIIDLSFGVPVPRARAGAGPEPLCTGWRTVAAPPAIRPKVIDARFNIEGGTFSGQ